MKKLRGSGIATRRIAAGSIAAATALGLTVMTAAPGTADSQNPNEDAEALGQLVESDLLNEQLVDAAGAYSSNPSSPDAAVTPLDVQALNALDLDLGNGVSLPIVSNPGGGGLLELGEAGALNSFGHASAKDSAKASAGAVGEDGALNLDDINNGDYGNAKVNLTQVLGQLGLDGVTDQIVDDLSLELGAVASTAEAKGTDVSSEYAVADGVLTVSSPALGDITDQLNGLVDDSGATLEEAIGNEGLVDELAKIGVDVDLPLGNSVNIGGEGSTVNVEVRDALNSVVENALNEELKDESGLVSIDLANGDIKIDLAKVVKGAEGEDLNSLDPNTQVLTSETIGKITDAVAGALGTLQGKVNTTLKDALNDVHVVIELPAAVTAAGLPVTDGKVTVDATLGQLAGTDPSEPTVTTDLTVAGIDLGEIVNGITGPIVDAILGVTEPIIGGILDSTAEQVTGGITDIVDPVLEGLNPVFEGLNQVVDLTVNEQPTLKDPAEESNLKGANADGFTVNAVSLELLPEADAVDVNLASSSVRATAAAEEPGDNANADATTAANGDNANADDSAAANGDNADATTASNGDNADATTASNGDAANADATTASNGDAANADATSAANGDNATANDSANADDTSAANDAASANASASSDDSASSAASGSDDSSNSASNAADLPRTGADGTLALSGLAALLIAGGAAALYVARRNRNMV